MPDFIEALDAIRAAKNTVMVIELLRAYLASLPHEELAQLPWGLNPELMRGPADVAMWTLHIQQGDLTGAAGGAGYGRIAKLLSEAALRLNQISALA